MNYLQIKVTDQELRRIRECIVHLIRDIRSGRHESVGGLDLLDELEILNHELGVQTGTGVSLKDPR